jgi:hypothetical protein
MRKSPGSSSGADKIAPVQGHGDAVAAGLAQDSGRDLDDPENEGDFGDLATDLVMGRAIHDFILCIAGLTRGVPV